MVNDKRLVFTKHAKDRIAELSLPWGKVVWMFHNSEIEKDRDVSRYKHRKYGDGEENVRQYRYDTYIFSVVETEDKFNPGEQINLLITIADQRLNLKE